MTSLFVLVTSWLVMTASLVRVVKIMGQPGMMMAMLLNVMLVGNQS